MKAQEVHELRTKSKGELKALLNKAKKELLSLKIDISLGKLKNVHAARVKRKDIAQILTVIREKFGEAQ